MKLQSNIIQITIKPASIARFLGGIALLLILASIVGQYIAYMGNFYEYPVTAKRLILLFELGSEQNLPTHFSVLLLLVSALLLMCMFFIERKQNSWSKPYWLILSIGFFFMMGDEAYGAHEKLITPVRNLLGSETFGIFYFAWVIPYSILVVILAIFFYKFLRKLPPSIRNNFLIAAAIYLGGAMGVELIGGYYAELYGSDNFTYSMIQTVEESLEMTGIIIFIWALLREITRRSKEVRLVFE